jgi:endonuclease/exonuclease/phosphatase family metal-dependent hydrolase
VKNTLLATSALGLVAALAVVGQPQASPASAAAAPATLRVGSFNIQSVSLDATTGNQRPWRTRRAGVVADILGERLDVVGVQEANPSRAFESRLVSASATTQYGDLKNGLNAAGGNYRVANSYAFNCVNHWTQYKCVYQYRGASGGDRILYNANTLSLVKAGGTKFKVQGTGGPLYIAWAILRVKSTGREFLFTNVHLRAGQTAAMRAQWKQLISRANQLKGSRPVIAVGDFNAHRAHPLAAEMLPAMKAAGYGDVLNQVYKQTPVANPRAKSTVNGWVNTVNRLDRNMRNWSYDDRRSWPAYNIDYVFATNSLPVEQWKVVVDYYPTTLQVKGVFPSDHNMVRATLTLP